MTTAILTEPAKLADVLTHLRRFYSDWAIANDMDCAVSVLDGASDRAVVRRYGRLRRGADGFRPRDSRSNNHAAIDPDDLRNLIGRSESAGRSVASICETCNKTYRRIRSTSRYCTDRCRAKGLRSLSGQKKGSVGHSSTTAKIRESATAVAGYIDGLSDRGQAKEGKAA